MASQAFGLVLRGRWLRGRLLWGSWQVTQPNAPPLSVLHRLRVQPTPWERTQAGLVGSAFAESPVEDVAVITLLGRDGRRGVALRG